MRAPIGLDVYEAGVERLAESYREGHRVVVSFSGGKDSTVILALASEAARREGRLPVEVVMRDEEILAEGTFEYCERVAERDDIEFHWLIANQPIINMYNRESPYFWVFDPLLDPSEWVRQPPPYAKQIPDLNIRSLITPGRFPPDEGKELIVVTGLRADESRVRLLSVWSARGHLTRVTQWGYRNSRPIYDWNDGDVWRAVAELGLDYSKAYDVMLRMGIPRRRMRIAPPTMNFHGVEQLQMGAKAWPAWFERVCRRLPGVRAAAHFGRRSVEPERQEGESWEQTYQRECIDRAPAWIAERATRVRDSFLATHGRHATTPFPDRAPCNNCQYLSWYALTRKMYGGDPFSASFTMLPYIEPEFFRAGAGVWGGTPSW